MKSPAKKDKCPCCKGKGMVVVKGSESRRCPQCSGSGKKQLRTK